MSHKGENMGTSIYWSSDIFGGYVHIEDASWSCTWPPDYVCVTTTNASDNGWYVVYMPEISFEEKLDQGIMLFFHNLKKLF